MRKKFIKSSRPTYRKRIKKAQQGMKFVSYNPVSNPTIDYKDITNPTNPFSEYNYNTTYDKPEALVVPVRDTDETDVVANNPTVEPVINKSVASKVTYTPKSYKGLAAFNKAYDEVEASNPEAKKYRQFLTKMAEQESGFNSAIQNRAGAPAYGYFQFMQDDKKYNNIRQYAGTDIETFRNNPKLQIEAAIKLAKSFEKGFSKEDLELANKNGYSTWGLLGGAWLAGNGGVRKFLRGQGNPSDRHWSKEGKGTDVATRIKAFNFKEGGIVKYQEPAHGVARRDAIKDYRPEIPLSPIKQPVKPYMPTQQPILSPDNRTGWEKEVSRQIKADRAKNDNLYGNQHTWNWSAPFTNARITKDNASAMFDFDKSAAMSTFAIGQGIASPVTTATSIATSLVGAGIGNKVAGEKGALVGGFVGGMVNPKIRFGKSSSTNQIRKDLIYGSKINGKMARLSQAEAEKANQEGYHNALSVIANPVVVATAKRNAEVAKRIGFKPLVYGINGKPVEFDNSSALHFYIMADEYPTSKIVRTDLGGMATGRWVRDPKTKQDRIELDNSVGDYKTAEEIFTHENLHKGRYGETRMQMLRVNKLIDEARAAEALPQMPEYLLGAGEAAVNTNDVRRALGLEFGQKYPGWKITKEIVDMFSRSKHPKAFVMKSFKQDTPRDYKRIWDALTGKWFMYPVALGVGMDLMNY